MRLLRLVWGGMVLFAGACVLVSWIALRGGAADSHGLTATAALGALGATLLAAQYRLRLNLDDARLFPRILDLGSWGLDGKDRERLQGLEVPERGARLIFRAHVVFGTLIWAMADAVAILGLVLAALTGEALYTVLFGTLALAGLLWTRPSEKGFREQMIRWERYVERNRGEDTPPAV